MRSDRRQLPALRPERRLPGHALLEYRQSRPRPADRAGHADGGDPAPGRRRLLPYRRRRRGGRAIRSNAIRPMSPPMSPKSESRGTMPKRSTASRSTRPARSIRRPRKPPGPRCAGRAIFPTATERRPPICGCSRTASACRASGSRGRGRQRDGLCDGCAGRRKGNRGHARKTARRIRNSGNATGAASSLKKGQVFRIAQVVGGQVGDCAFYNADDPKEMFHCGQSWAINVTAGTGTSKRVQVLLFQAAARERHDDGAGRHLSQPLGQYGRALLDPALRNPRQSPARQPPLVPGKPA